MGQKKIKPSPIAIQIWAGYVHYPVMGPRLLTAFASKGKAEAWRLEDPSNREIVVYEKSI